MIKKMIFTVLAVLPVCNTSIAQQKDAVERVSKVTVTKHVQFGVNLHKFEYCSLMGHCDSLGNQAYYSDEQLDLIIQKIRKKIKTKKYIYNTAAAITGGVLGTFLGFGGAILGVAEIGPFAIAAIPMGTIAGAGIGYETINRKWTYDVTQKGLQKINALTSSTDPETADSYRIGTIEELAQILDSALRTKY